MENYLRRLGKMYLFMFKLTLVFVAAFIIMILSIVKGIGFGIFMTIFIFGSYWIIKGVWKESRKFAKKIAMDKSSQL